jgi:hypothetical protein
MNNRAEFWSQVIKYWIYGSPFIVAYAIGAIVAIRRGGLSTRPSRLVLIGCTASFVLSLVMPAGMIHFTWILSARGESIYDNSFLDAFSLLTNVLMALAFSLILRAAFVERSSPPQG